MKAKISPVPRTAEEQGHPGVWPGGESAEIRELYDLTIAGSATDPPRIAPRSSYRPRKGTQ